MKVGNSGEQWLVSERMSEGGSGGKILIFRKSLPFRFGGE
jgi:hypothetical protein